MPELIPTRRWLLAALAVSALLLTGCNDVDGDGVDDTTGQPVAVQQRPNDTGSSGCGPGGWELLCGGGDPSPASGGELDQPVGADPDWTVRVARPEAAHVAVAREIGARGVTAWLNPDGSGRTSVRRLPADPQLIVTYLVAGVVADGTDEYGEMDFAQIAEVLDTVPPAEHDPIMTAARAAAARIIAERGEEIDRDAARLLEHGSL